MGGRRRGGGARLHLVRAVEEPPAPSEEQMEDEAGIRKLKEMVDKDIYDDPNIQVANDLPRCVRPPPSFVK